MAFRYLDLVEQNNGENVHVCTMLPRNKGTNFLPNVTVDNRLESLSSRTLSRGID